MEKLTWGIEGLDKLIGDAIAPGSLIAIAGHPGAGKTTLASTICYANTLRGRKCLYISFQESRNKLFRVMKRLGIDLESAEGRGFLKFINFPLALMPEEFLSEIKKIVERNEYKVIVIDSINPLLGSVEGNLAKRAILQNFLYNLPSITNGLTILLAELPVGEKSIWLGELEFVVDSMIIMRHRIEKSMLVRLMEIRKTRNTPVSVAQIPFSIAEGRGVEVWPPPIIEEVPSVKEEEKIELPCKTLSAAFKHLHRGHVIYITYPADARPWFTPMIFLGLSIKNDLKTLLISYRYASSDLAELIKRSLVKIGVEDVNELISRYFKLVGLNPFTMSIQQLLVHEVNLVKEAKPDVVIFHGVEIPFSATRTREYMPYLINQLNYLKKEQVLIIRTSSYLSEKIYRVNAGISDVVINIGLIKASHGGFSYNAYLWRRAEEPLLIDSNEVDECLSEIKGLINCLGAGQSVKH
ncbi:MAG: ATPase domain-containing protein [Desulfurococcaceae archaeon]|nr:AAA family ATPase [Sulfolobales archaeon]MDW8169659.1 ATPase domain-containing protein [Desulfurococcaceae archaeon]